MPWYAKFIIAGIAVTIAGFAAKQFNATLGGMILAFPFVIGTGLIFARTDSMTAYVSTAQGALMGLVPLTVFLLCVVFLGDKIPTIASLAAGVVSWVVVAGSLLLIRGAE